MGRRKVDIAFSRAKAESLFHCFMYQATMGQVNFILEKPSANKVFPAKKITNEARHSTSFVFNFFSLKPCGFARNFAPLRELLSSTR